MPSMISVLRAISHSTYFCYTIKYNPNSPSSSLEGFGDLIYLVLGALTLLFSRSLNCVLLGVPSTALN